MSYDDPYRPPSSQLERQTAGGAEFSDPKRLPAGRGWFWITTGFHLFARNPGIWILNMIIFFVITIFIAFIPLVSIVNNILQPIFLGGLMRGAQTQDEGGNFEVGHLFAGFSEKGSKLAILGALQLGMMIAYGIIIVILGLIFIGAPLLLNHAGGDINPQMIITSVGFLLFIPVLFISIFLFSMAIWLTPQLVMLHDLDPVMAVKMSFIGSWRNVWPLFVFGIMAMLLIILAIIPLGLGIFVMWPTLTAATYVAWKDIFTDGYAV